MNALANLVRAPSSTLLGGVPGALLLTNAASAPQNDIMFWLNLAAGVLSIIIGAISGRVGPNTAPPPPVIRFYVKRGDKQER